MARIRSMSRLALLALVLGVFAPGLAGAQNDEPPLSPPGALFGAGQFAHQDGATLYRAICQGCHMPDARGAVGAGFYPALAANSKLASAPYPVLTVLNGRRNMPALGGYLSDTQVAAVVNFVRSHFGNAYADTVSAADVTKLRAPSGAKP
jgi:mono/diheme cytochrome c family protein